jgi:hypothetical protein
MNRWKSWMGDSLWKRTALSVTGLLAGSALFVGILSFGLVSVTEGVLSPNKSKPSVSADEGDSAVPGALGPSGATGPKSPAKPLKSKRPGAQQAQQERVDDEPLP